MDWETASRALDMADDAVRNIERIKKQVQHAVAANDAKALRAFSSSLASLSCQLLTETPRYRVADELYTSYDEAEIAAGALNEGLSPRDPRFTVIDVFLI